MPTRTPETDAAYVYRGELLTRAYAKNGGADWRSDPDAFVRWLEGRRQGLATATWRQYRAATSFYVEQQGQHSLAAQIRDLSSDGALTRHQRRSSKRLKTSATKAKYLSPETLRKIVEQLADADSKYAPAVRCWLLATIALGPRPAEWRRARWIEPEPGQGETVRILEVVNAKNSNGRANGPTRRLIVENRHPGVLKSVAYIFEVVRRMKGDEATWRTFYKGMQDTLRTAVGSLHGNTRRPTFYSARHQFCANAKAAGFSRVEVAAMMGHAVDDTAAEHYGRRIYGRGTFNVRPHQEDVDRVKEAYEPGMWSPPSKPHAASPGRPSKSE